MIEKIYNFKIRKQIHFLKKEKKICFVNVETDPSLGSIG